ncbi:hypothetical protein D3C77_311520 [compost metagenome]
MLLYVIEDQAQSCSRRSRDGEWVDQAQNVAAHCSGRRGDSAKHILELAALLKEHRQRSLPALEAHSDVGELGRYPAKSSVIGFRRHPGLVHAVRCFAQRIPHRVDSLRVLDECVALNDPGLLELGQTLLHIVQPTQGCGGRIDLAQQLG